MSSRGGGIAVLVYFWIDFIRSMLRGRRGDRLRVMRVL